MSDALRQGSGSTGANSGTIANMNGFSQGGAEGVPQFGSETIQVEQVTGAEMSQRVVEFDMVAPAGKPDIEQVVDVYVKNVQIHSVDIITDKVIVRGDLEVKVMYVAALPNQPVHAFERAHIRFTRDIAIDGAERGMKAKADVSVEYVDYDFDENDNRSIHITIVLKFWARVVSTTDMDVYALNPLEQAGSAEVSSAIGSTGQAAAASYDKTDIVSAANVAGNYEPAAVEITGPGIQSSTGMQNVQGGLGTVAGTNVNVRTGPGTNFPVITKVNVGDVVTIQEQAFGWYKVLLPDNNTIGWIAGWLVGIGNEGQSAEE